MSDSVDKSEVAGSEQAGEPSPEDRPARRESDDVAAAYQDPSKSEMGDLERVFGPKTPGGTLGIARNYVAPPAPGYDVHGIWHTYGAHHRTGYATHAVSLHWMLSKILGIPTQLIPHRNSDIDFEKFPEDRHAMLFEWLKEAVGHPHVLFCSFPPEVSAEMEGVTNAIVTYCAFEGDKVGDYAKSLASGPIFAKVWVVSQFVKEAFLAAGVSEDRVHLVRPMLTTGPWSMTPTDLLSQQKNKPVTHDDPFTFGVLGTWQKRKGMHDLVRAYFSAFKRNEPVRLHVKTSPFGDGLTVRKFKDKAVAEIAEIAREFGDDGYPTTQKMPRITLDIGTELTDRQVIELIGSFDCYANPSYGEGLGIPHTWAKAQGLPMVTSDYGAVGQLVAELGSEMDELVTSSLVPVDPTILPHSLMFDRATRWGVYQPIELGYAMRKQYEAGRRFDALAAMRTRKLFGEDCVGAVRDGLCELVSPKIAKDWGLAT